MKKFIRSADGLPAWSAPISHAVVVDRTCWLSGQLSLDAQGRYVPDTPAGEARRAFGHLARALEAAGFTLADMVFVDVALVDLGDVGEVNAVFAEMFAEDRRPARTVYQAAALPFGGKLKVMGVAVKERGG